MQPINHSEDLVRLRDEGVEYSLVKGTLLVVGDVPYLNQQATLNFGTLIIPLSISGTNLQPPADHTAHWKGEQPCYSDGSFIPGLVSCPERRDFGEGIVSDFFLSRKPVENNGKYLSYYDKVTQHIAMISTPAREQYPDECRKKALVVPQSEGLPFVYGDTNAARAKITGISERLEGLVIAIIGLGGTGMYLLDFLAKCPVAEIHLFDDDVFANHNAFRAPGAAGLDVLNQHLSKVQYAADMYGKMKRGVIPHKEKIGPDNISAALDAMDFVFICVDSSDARNLIAKYLADNEKPFVDSGLGLEIVNGRIVGQVRVTTAFPGHYDHLWEAFGSTSEADNPYASNIQIAELNALAAIESIIKWKKLLDFYGDTSSLKDLNCVFSVQTNSIIKATEYES